MVLGTVSATDVTSQPLLQVMLLLQKLLLKVEIEGSCRGAEPLRIHSDELTGQLGDNSTPDEALDCLLVCSVLVQMPKANCHNRWTVSELWPNPKPLALMEQ